MNESEMRRTVGGDEQVEKVDWDERLWEFTKEQLHGTSQHVNVVTTHLIVTCQSYQLCITDMSLYNIYISTKLDEFSRV